MKERAKELKAEARADKDKAAGERALLAKIAEMPEPDRGLASDPPARLYVPDLFTIECTAILWRYGMRLGLSQPDAHLFVAQLGQLRLLSFPTETLLSDALDIALAHDITACDAAYVALAQQLALPLVTADARLARGLAPTTHDLRWLGDLPGPAF